MSLERNSTDYLDKQKKDRNKVSIITCNIIDCFTSVLHNVSSVLSSLFTRIFTFLSFKRNSREERAGVEKKK